MTFLVKYPSKRQISVIAIPVSLASFFEIDFGNTFSLKKFIMLLCLFTGLFFNRRDNANVSYDIACILQFVVIPPLSVQIILNAFVLLPKVQNRAACTLLFDY